MVLLTDCSALLTHQTLIPQALSYDHLDHSHLLSYQQSYFIPYLDINSTRLLHRLPHRLSLTMYFFPRPQDDQLEISSAPLLLSCPNISLSPTIIKNLRPYITCRLLSLIEFCIPSSLSFLTFSRNSSWMLNSSHRRMISWNSLDSTF